MVRLLLRYGAQPDMRDKDGITASTLFFLQLFFFFRFLCHTLYFLSQFYPFISSFFLIVITFHLLAIQPSQLISTQLNSTQLNSTQFNLFIFYFISTPDGDYSKFNVVTFLHILQLFFDSIYNP